MNYSNLMLEDDLQTTKVVKTKGRKKRFVSSEIMNDSGGRMLPQQERILPEKGDASRPLRYEYHAHVAEGGMGRVSVILDHDLKRPVAIKSILPQKSASEDVIDRFIREAQILAQLQHPNIVPLYDMGKHHTGELYFTMKYVNGRTLAEIIQSLREGNAKDMTRFSWSRRVQIIRDICDAIQFAHDHGIAHCDLKPANIMIGDFGEVVVMDWGLAIQFDKERKISSNESSGIISSTITTTEIPNENKDEVVGTPAYMPVEVIDGDSSDPKARDIYAIGVLMYEFLGLQKPFSGHDLTSLVDKIRNSKPKPLYDIKDKHKRRVPVELHHIVKNLIAKRKEKRYESCAKLIEDLQLYLDGRFPIHCPSTALKRWTLGFAHLIDDHPKLLVMAGVAAGLTLSAVLYSLIF